jgi:hypothetical protein
MGILATRVLRLINRFWGKREGAATGRFAGRGEREERGDAHSDKDKRMGAALPGFALYL